MVCHPSDGSPARLRRGASVPVGAVWCRGAPALVLPSPTGMCVRPKGRSHRMVVFQH